MVQNTAGYPGQAVPNDQGRGGRGVLIAGIVVAAVVIAVCVGLIIWKLASGTPADNAQSAQSAQSSQSGNQTAAPVVPEPTEPAVEPTAEPEPTQVVAVEQAPDGIYVLAEGGALYLLPGMDFDLATGAPAFARQVFEQLGPIAQFSTNPHGGGALVTEGGASYRWGCGYESDIEFLESCTGPTGAVPQMGDLEALSTSGITQVAVAPVSEFQVGVWQLKSDGTVLEPVVDEASPTDTDVLQIPGKRITQIASTQRGLTVLTASDGSVYRRYGVGQDGLPPAVVPGMTDAVYACSAGLTVYSVDAAGAVKFNKQSMEAGQAPDPTSGNFQISSVSQMVCGAEVGTGPTSGGNVTFLLRDGSAEVVFLEVNGDFTGYSSTDRKDLDGYGEQIVAIGQRSAAVSDGQLVLWGGYSGPSFESTLLPVEY